jgi:L-ribulokinase
VNPELGGVTLGWNLTHTPEDESFAAIEGTAFHTRVILERMAEHGDPVTHVINGGGIPQRNEVLNHVYANVLNKPILIPEGDVTSLAPRSLRSGPPAPIQALKKPESAVPRAPHD